MNVSFSSAALAALCNSEHRLAQRWGPDVGRTVGRRLLDLADADARALDCLPGARVGTNGTGETTIGFGDQIVVRGVMSGVSNGRRAAQAESDTMVITSLDVHGSDQ